ncbi:hypothetical protein C3R44_21580, partial [Mycobacterium tuberculosis]
GLWGPAGGPAALLRAGRLGLCVFRPRRFVVPGGAGPGPSRCGRAGVLRFLVLPPAVHSALLFAGAGSGPPLA